MHEPFDEESDEAAAPEEETESYKSEWAQAFEEWAFPYFDRREVNGADLMVVMGNLMVRSRALLTFDELHAWVHTLLVGAEKRVQAGTAFVDGDGNDVNMLLAEERRALDTETIEVPDTIPEDWS